MFIQIQQSCIHFKKEMTYYFVFRTSQSKQNIFTFKYRLQKQFSYEFLPLYVRIPSASFHIIYTVYIILKCHIAYIFSILIHLVVIAGCIMF